MVKLCACGMPLHYTSKVTESQVVRLVEKLGECIPVSANGVRYLVQRHFIALHGLNADDLPQLAEQGIVERDE